ncbi:MAG: hypothetical protein ACLRWQ_19470 [Flavonifractor plautii]
MRAGDRGADRERSHVRRPEEAPAPHHDAAYRGSTPGSARDTTRRRADAYNTSRGAAVSAEREGRGSPVRAPTSAWRAFTAPKRTWKKIRKAPCGRDAHDEEHGAAGRGAKAFLADGS